jgi:acetyltransferase
MMHRSNLASSDGIAGEAPAARSVRLKDGRLAALRVACAGDAPAVQRFVRGLSVSSRMNRFFSPIRELSPDLLDRITRSRLPGEFTLVGESLDGAESRIVAMAQYVVDEPLDAEFALVVDDDWQRQGLGNELLGVLAEHAARTGLATFTGLVLYDNWPMLALLSRLHCEFASAGDPRLIRVVKRFDAGALAV